MPNTRDATYGPAYYAPNKEPIDGDEMTLYHNFLLGCSIEDVVNEGRGCIYIRLKSTEHLNFGIVQMNIDLGNCYGLNPSSSACTSRLSHAPPPLIFTSAVPLSTI
ncbi:hypothetical protein PF008_g12860 [Phytophthora fragariae]|uniref:Uncharacterized protein n=1 Tax=Phytophthora fragariae TaxID=53985 RepID=A0A6G0RLK6_9STRA|nr:hypothetical protein PF008_g12860 [Phytophthora fragariae]